MKTIIVVISLLLLFGVCSVATALTPDLTPIITTDKPWVVAGGTETSTITVKVLNSTAPTTPVAGAVVTIVCDDPSLGSVSPGSQVVGNTSQTVSFTFRTTTRSGDAHLSVSVSNEGVTAPSSEVIQRVDHAVPKYFSRVIYPNSTTVAEDATIVVQLIDRYGNPIDNKREVYEGRLSESLAFADSPDSNGGFHDGVSLPAHTMTRYTDSAGNTTVLYRMPTRAGDDILQITAPAGVVSNQTNTNFMWITIKGLPDDPVKITSTITSPYDPNPDDPYLAVANGADIFTIYYTVYDQHDNPVPSVDIDWTATSLSTGVETKDFLTNYQGMVYLEYGPSTELHSISLSARLQKYPSVPHRDDELRFTSGGPAIFAAYANPQLLASREANPSSWAYVRGHLMDNMGRPIVGEMVTFSIMSDVGSVGLVEASSFANGTYQQTISAPTDGDGFATVIFYPGVFPDEFSEDFSQNATATATIVASWANATLGLGDQDTLEITYKNYPYIRVETFVNPTTVDVNSTINVTIQLTGDGYAPHYPIDLVLCNNRAEPMLSDMYYMGDTGAKEDKMVYVHQVSRNFLFQFRPAKDRIGIVTFGNDEPTYLTQDSGFRDPGDDNNQNDASYVTTKYTAHVRNYTDHATIDLSLNSSLQGNLTLIGNEIGKMTPSKDPGWLPNGRYLSPMRLGIYKSIKELNDNARAQSVKAVIVLTDRAWSQAGDPIARNPSKGKTLAEQSIEGGSWSNGGTSEFTVFTDLGDKNSPLQNMSNYAIASGARIYVIAYPEKGNSINTADQTTFTILSTSTGGRYFLADSVEELSNIYDIIAEELRRYAGAESTMALNFTAMNVTYDNITTGYSGSDVFDYEYEYGVSTLVTSWNKTTYPNPITDKLPVPPYPASALPAPVNGNLTYPFTVDQRAEWAGNGMTFYVGNITIGQTWQSKFRLKALIPGLVNLFGNSSEICFDSATDGGSCITLPETMLTAVQNTTNATLDQVQLDIIDGSLNATPSASTEILNVTWVMNYTGNNTVEQKAYYQFSSDGATWSGNWVEFGENTTGDHPIDHQEYFENMDVRDMVGYVRIKIFSYEIPLGGASDVEETRDAIPVGRARLASIKIS